MHDTTRKAQLQLRLPHCPTMQGALTASFPHEAKPALSAIGDHH
jgi:hypothetical protein